MTLTPRFHPETELELEAAVEWYEDQEPGLGGDLLARLEETLTLVLEWPRIAPVFPGWGRDPLVRTQAITMFPYRALYYLTDCELMLIAFAHNRRKPGYWQDRL